MTEQNEAHAQDASASDRMAIAEIIGGKIFNDIPDVIPATRYARKDALEKADLILALRTPAVCSSVSEDDIFDLLYRNVYADNDGVAGLSAFVEELLQKFDVRTKTNG
jgi:hypothetical protein